MTIRKLLISFCLCLMINPIKAQTYQPNWASLDRRPIPVWWTDAKFGIFVHWGLYSVPAYAPTKEVKGVYEKYAEHYESRLMSKNELFMKFHNQHFGAKFTYQDFAPLFKAEYFDADQWAELFKKAGAKYVVLTSKHHDGFCLWPSQESPKWNSMDIGPHMDIVDELTSAVRKKGLHMGLYYSLLEWDHPLYKEKTIDQYVDQHMIPQLKDLVNRYEPEIIFADGEWDYSSSRLKSESFLSWLYNESPVKQTVVVDDRWGKETRSKHGDYYTTEYNLVNDQEGIGSKASHPWEESRGIGTSYGYNRFETTDDYLSPGDLIRILIEKVSNGGNLLLDVGPDANGLIPVIMQERLLEIGAWLQVNGEAIFQTTAWAKSHTASKQKKIYFTRKGHDLYVLCTQWPEGPIIIKGINRASKVNMLGLTKNIRFKEHNNHLIITPPALLPSQVPCLYGWVLKVADVDD